MARTSTLKRREWIEGYVCIAPWLIGLVALVIGPMIYSFYLGFTTYDYVSPPVFVGLSNYRKALADDPLFWLSLKVTFQYAVMALPLQLVVSFGLALLLNLNLRGGTVFRTIFYLPSVLPLIAVSILFNWVFHPRYGILNWGLSLIGIRGPGWIFDPAWALPALVLMSLWSLGRPMLVYLAGLQNIDHQLYDAARVDGAGVVKCFWHITVPMMTPVIFFNLVMGVIGAFQVFIQAYIMTGGGPLHATHFYMFYLFQEAFRLFRAGYASSLAWVLFVIIMFLTLLVLRSSQAWVYYESELKGR